MPSIASIDLNDPVGRHMRRDVACLHVDQTVGEALESLRRSPPEGRILYLYVVDGAGKLRGVVPTRRLLLSSLEQMVSLIMVERVIALPEDATVLDACEFFIQHRLLAFPVVDAERRLLGQVDVDLYTEEMEQLSEGSKRDNLFQLIGVHVAQAQQVSAFSAFRLRFPWLACNMVGGILAAFLSGMYQEELARTVALALFIPVVLALAESVSIQSVSLALLLLQGPPPSREVLAAKFRKELATGLMLGAASGMVVALVALAWLGGPLLALCLLAGIGGGVAAAALIGLAIPSLLHLLERDPHVAAGPVALALSDLVTLLVYFNLARFLLG